MKIKNIKIDYPRVFRGYEEGYISGQQIAERFEWVQSTCSDCKGSKMYNGLLKQEICKKCGGIGIEFSE